MIIVLVILAGLILFYGPQLWARAVLSRYDRDEYFSGSGLDLARLLVERLKLEAVQVTETPLGDHYDPRSKTVRLNQARGNRRSLTAVVVAVHEVGHAIQHQARYGPLETRTRLIGTAAKMERIGAILMMGLPIVTAITRIPATGALMLLAGLLTLGVPVVVHFLTLPTEFDASFNRALPILASGEVIPPEDLPAARTILWACALTYVAAALAGMVNVWRWIRVLRR
ncbi:MAG: zinc metallopeptidase [Desulfosarcinaceae bacterium]|nr:zinc metallopeptidase [Desulfosarcinaceae bacterium]